MAYVHRAQRHVRMRGCRTQEPPLAELAPGHRVACYLPENLPV